MKHPDDMSNSELIVWQEGRINELELQLSHYQGGVEVEGIWKQDGILFYPLPAVQLEFNQKARVLVMKEVE